MILSKRYKAVVFLSVIFFSCHLSVFAQNNEIQKISQYNNDAIKLINQAKYDEALPFCDSALSIKENVITFYILASISVIKNNWEEAITNGEKAIQLDSAFMPAYPVLFNAYFGAHRWKDAVNISDKAQKADPSGYTNGRVKYSYDSLKQERVSNVISIFFFIVLSYILFIRGFRSSKVYLKQNLAHSSQASIGETLLVTFFVSCILYSTFYALSGWILSFNPYISASEFTPNTRAYIFEHDGIESFFLYVMMLFNIVLSVFMSHWLLNIQLSKNQLLLRNVVVLPFAGYYLYQIGFFPPVPDFDNTSQTTFGLVFVIALITLLLYFLYNRYILLVKSVLFIFIVFTTFIVSYPSSLPDLAYVFSPALRLINGFKVHEIYFQYDLLLSLFSVFWLKLNIALEWFPFLGQISFLFFFLGAFLFSDRFFKSRGLSVLFIVALILIRYYAVWEQGVTIFQVSPLRLDLWLILLIVGYQKGIQHWIFGICLGLMIIFHRNLGLIYLAAYLVLLLSLFVVELISLLQENKLTFKLLGLSLISNLRNNAINLGIIIVSFVLCLVLTGEIFSSSALTYRKYGIGMLPVSKDSFYWYFPIVLSSVAVLLFYYKKLLSAKYFTTVLLLILLAISNSMYFFGRSHENNILNISGVMVLTLFVLFDLLIFFSSEIEIKYQKKIKKPSIRKLYSLKKMVFLLLPFLFIILSSYFYSNRITNKLNNKFDNLANSRFKYPLLENSVDTMAIKEITDSSRKIYFLDFQMDFYYYHYGKYAPVGYFNPSGAWVFKNDLTTFLQGLLDDNYFIVLEEQKINSYNEYLPYLKYNRSVKKNGLLSIHKEPVPLLISSEPNELFHIGVKDSLPVNGLDCAGISIKNEFTIEAIVKPFGAQLPHAMILNNLININGQKGLTIEYENNITDRYLFAYGNGSGNMPVIAFPLSNNIWHYLAITVNDKGINIYDNGNFVTSLSSNNESFVNSDLPITFGNRQSRDSHFSGYIREVKISNGNVNKNEIQKRGQELNKLLNTASVPK